MINKYEKELKVAKKIAKQAGKIMLQYFDADQMVENKKDNSQVTIADKKINRLVIEELSKNFKDIIIGEEESTGNYGTGRRWFCDPIDGTKAFIWGEPTAMFSLALVIDGVPVLGVAYDPFLDKLYEGIAGFGSYCNGKPLKTSKKELDGGILAITSSIDRLVSAKKLFDAFKKKGVLLAIFSGAVYKTCLVATGRLIGFIAMGVNAHDMAAVHVIIEESGGKITDFKGKKLDYTKPFRGALVSNGVVHNTLIKYLDKYQ